MNYRLTAISALSSYSVILNATVLLPVSNMAVMLRWEPRCRCRSLSALAAYRAGIGEFTGYLIGRSGRELVDGNTGIFRLNVG
jgi:hypothetical protein